MKAEVEHEQWLVLYLLRKTIDEVKTVVERIFEMITDKACDQVPSIEFLPNLPGKTIRHDIDEWDQKFMQVDQEMLFEIILAANFLDIKNDADLYRTRWNISASWGCGLTGL